jgi:SNF2 family DNA or RNA helicase
MIRQACAGLFLDPGLGKTSISLAAFSILGSKAYVKGMLIIAPLRAVYNVWPNETRKWQDFKDLIVGILHGKDKEAVLKEEHDIYCINPEGLTWLIDILAKTPVLKWPFDMLVVDESTKFKDSQTKRFKALRKVLHKFSRRYILTGTPTPNGLLDLFGQIYILDLGHSLGAYITHYRNTFFIPSGFGGYSWVPKFDTMERVGERIAPLVLRMKAEDYLELPQLVNQMTWLDLPAPARKIYKDIENEFIALVGGEVVLVPSAAAAGNKCRQILNGAAYINAQKDWREIHDVKLEALSDLVEELSGAPLLVLYEFQHDKERIMKKFPKCGMIGGQSMQKDRVVINKFNEGSLGMVLGHPASMGHALNLQGSCTHVCWFGLTWNFEHYDQAIRRVWRQGNDAARVVVHHLCIRQSLDEVVVKTVNSKDKTQAQFMMHVQSLR